MDTPTKPTVKQLLGRPWSVDQLTAFRAKMPDRYRVSVDLGAGCGLRQGEIFGVSPTDLDPTRPVLQVVRQVKLVRGALIFAPPKGGKTREVPLPASVSRRLAEHAEQYPPVEVALPWATPTGDPVTVTLYLTDADDLPLSRSKFNPGVWKHAIRATGIPDDRRNGMHVLRHTYPRFSWMPGRASRPCRRTWATPTPDSPCGPTPICCPAVRTAPAAPSTRRSVRTRPTMTVRNPVTAWGRHDHGSTPTAGAGSAGHGTCGHHLALK